MATINFWFDFASPYSMISVLRLARAMAGTGSSDVVRGLASCQAPDLAGVGVVFKPVFLGGLFKEVGQAALPNMQVPAKGKHLFQDVRRSLDLLGVRGFPATRPASWPPNPVLADRMAWLLAQGPDYVRALDSGDASPPATPAGPLPPRPTAVLAEFVWRVYEAEFIADHDIGSPEVLAALWDKHVAGCGHDLGGPLPAGQRAVELAGTAAVKAGLTDNTSAAAAAGLFGVPSFTTEDNAMYWGNDRLLDAVAHHRIRHLLSPPAGPGDGAANL
ncbi:hypothetical protein H4R21_000566 [Coemansia helicoidea]|uniref:Uncharacterized protein n=1 Tax=Coemansia helicoidea TaxID=1286919 RepID=A0ACC1LFM4_9FUNG|nr:hypothetical protein H4R21_000566 [Coemansia helicoidea]